MTNITRFMSCVAASLGPLCVFALLVSAVPGHSQLNIFGDSISTDTVRMCPVDSFVSAKDTGAAAKKIGWRLGVVSMSHLKHERAGISCVFCHHKKNNDERIKQCSRCHKGVAGMENLHNKCGQCHMMRKQDMGCAKCHGETGAKPQAELMRFKFSHAKHYPRKKECNFCHEEPLKTAWMQKDNYPAMKTCLSCHDNRKASGQCSACHNDVAQITPKSHNYAWVGRYGHGRDANYNKAECMQCHSKSGCDQCHLGQTSCKVHVPGYRYVHGMDVRMATVNCAMCHETRNSCAQCHENRR